MSHYIKNHPITNILLQNNMYVSPITKRPISQRLIIKCPISQRLSTKRPISQHLIIKCPITKNYFYFDFLDLTTCTVLYICTVLYSKSCAIC